MKQCNHNGGMRYARRTLINGTVHYCIQCRTCGEVIKHKRHNYRPLIKHHEIPTGYQIHEFKETDLAQGGKTDE